MLSESAIQLAAAKLQAEIDAAAKIEQLQAEINDRVDQKIKQMQLEEKKKVDGRTAKERMDDVIREMKFKHHGEIIEEKIDTPQHLHVCQSIFQLFFIDLFKEAWVSATFL